MDKTEIIKKLNAALELIDEVKKSLTDTEEKENEVITSNTINTRCCNFCFYASGPGLPDGVICNEPHHIEAGAKERHQYYRGVCPFYKYDKTTNIYNL